jgi:hypothetical protein
VRNSSSAYDACVVEWLESRSLASGNFGSEVWRSSLGWVDFFGNEIFEAKFGCEWKRDF